MTVNPYFRDRYNGKCFEQCELVVPLDSITVQVVPIDAGTAWRMMKFLSNFLFMHHYCFNRKKANGQ